ncbi:hypothetical protein PRUB_a1522 [Pseudoalteromonas rubra]|uniref:Uncharacterized protein n=1 Tax=Pseudoalteromonas rubra TaxID=43658 RepID=A0A8T0CCM7_9GAMM|nr:hypothetical protein [Pseudoalteromonas rubra]KAF7788534.1 hypothetical protein PRUB_a1522 [Pseudoalteromonas rubra]
MTLTPPPGHNHNEAPPSAVHVMFGNFTASVKDHKALVIIMSVVLFALCLFLMKPDQVKEFLDRRFIEPDAWEQYDLYDEAQKSVFEVIENWNRIKSIDDTHTTEVKTIRANIKGVLHRFKNLETSSLPRINVVIWHHDLARLYNIQFDITKNERYLKKALEHLAVADKISSGDVTPKLTKAEIMFFEEHDISHEIQWTYLASYSINAALGRKQYSTELNEIKVYFGGCRMLLDESLEHKRMLQGIGCDA